MSFRDKCMRVKNRLPGGHCLRGVHVLPTGSLWSLPRPQGVRMGERCVRIVPGGGTVAAVNAP